MKDIEKIINLNLPDPTSMVMKIAEKIAYTNAVGSKKFIQKMIGPHCIPKRNGHLYFATMPDKKYIDTSALYMEPLKTQNGTLYCCKPGMIDAIMCFTAHVFDRYRDRFSVHTNRTILVHEFFKNFVQISVCIEEKATGKTWIFTEDGLTLGIIAVHNNVKVILFKTFITLDMLRTNQTELLGRAVDILHADSKASLVNTKLYDKFKAVYESVS